MRLLRFGRPNKEPRYDLTDELATARVELTKRTGERDSALAQVALKAALIVQLTDKLRAAEASLSDARDSERAAVKSRKAAHEDNALLMVEMGKLGKRIEGLERQAEVDRKTIAELGKEAAEAIVTAEGLGLAMRDMEQAAAERKAFLNEDHRHVRLMDGAEDHL